MATPDLSELRELMGPAAEQLPALQGLDQSDADRLAGLLSSAQQKQREMILEASEEALGHVPALLRKAVRKLLFDS